jgi:hypothetical protein
MMAIRRRNPLVQIALIALASLLGIGSRRIAHLVPGFIAAYAEDTLWALAAFAGIGFLLPRASTRTVALLAMAFSIAIELSQLYHAPWIDSIRQTTLGGLILGYGFLWSDLACYAAGVGLGVILELIVLAALYPKTNYPCESTASHTANSAATPDSRSSDSRNFWGGRSLAKHRLRDWSMIC